MRFLANENFPFPSTKMLRENNFYVKSISEDCPGISDLEVMKIAIEEDLIILTFDKDYGEIIFKSGYFNPPSVVFFRYKGVNQSFAGEYILKMLIDQKKSLKGSFFVIEQENYRQRLYKI
jgi:predicted nuclease of predicted toxin-antitoxin system